MNSRFLQLAKKINCFYLNGILKGECRPFFVDGKQVGLIRPDVVNKLLNYPEVFIMRDSDLDGRGIIELNPAFRDYNERTTKVEQVLLELRDKDEIITLRGWRNEYFEVKDASNNCLLKMDRAATPMFAIRNYGVTINGYVRHPDLGLCMWFQQRSDTKQTWPGFWDNMVSGGVTVGYGIKETAVKESQEEASVPQSFLENLVSVGSVSFFFESERGLFPNTEYVFDLELPMDFEPKCIDGEVQAFELMPITKCLDWICSTKFKTTSTPVVIDFMIRHGIINTENEPNFSEIVELIHVPLQSIYKMNLVTSNGKNGFSSHDSPTKSTNQSA
ncbi:uncharacterized protein LOC134830692 [Culicoides brevitarsis]|uniref:uncharacterized protein LOC134830692 n=1 Tax=Culicoides brevitarsis TaxID=469753 RepID=UPI00307B89C7